MSNNTKATTFWNFLKENTIEIPIIQRDYAQGRLGKENLRKNFLKDLRSALNDKGTLKLDFVYGSMENGFTGGATTEPLTVSHFSGIGGLWTHPTPNGPDMRSVPSVSIGRNWTWTSVSRVFCILKPNRPASSDFS